MNTNDGVVIEAEANPAGDTREGSTAALRLHAAVAEAGTAGAKVEAHATEPQSQVAGATGSAAEAKPQVARAEANGAEPQPQVAGAARRRRRGPRDHAPPVAPEQDGVAHVQPRPAHTEGRCERVLSLETWPIGRLLPSPRNARTHSDAQVAEIAGSIRAFGFANPILVGDDGDVIAGHGRLAAARKLGLAEVPVIRLSGLSEIERRQLMLADNRIALNAGWDLDMLRLELTDLADLGADLKSLGFTKQELAAALTPHSEGLTDENAVPEAEEVSVSRPGDLWVMGSHRVLCGDCTDADIVARLLGKALPRLMVTDPPYGVAYDPAWRHRLGVNQSKRTGKVKNDDQADWGAAWALFPGNIAYVWHGALHASTVAASLERHDFKIRAQIIWAKERFAIGRGDYHWGHEPCWYAVRDKGFWTGDRKQTTLWTIPSGGQDAETVHGTQKPVECMRRPILNNSEPGDAVYDPFLGSGTTLIAAETTGRVCQGIEIDPRYVDVIIKRWQAFTGKAAMLDGDGRSFEAIAVERLGRAAAVTPQDDPQSASSKISGVIKISEHPVSADSRSLDNANAETGPGPDWRACECEPQKDLCGVEANEAEDQRVPPTTPNNIDGEP